jgi:hypothetical protein
MPRFITRWSKLYEFNWFLLGQFATREFPVYCSDLDVVGGPSTPHDPESDAGGSLSSWQGHPSR